jgi:hypothetical protein
MPAIPPSLARLAEWADGNSGAFEVVAQKRDADAPVADSALEVVRRFIVERGLILYGGLAIDFALRLKGSGIYPEHQTPDYDFFSPRHVDDAYELADRLVAAGFSHVGAIPAIHVQTMRVATDFIYVADVSYAPPEVFGALPTVPYAGMRVLHPDYQRIDMHLAFCFPFSNPPREDIFHRYRKDLKRFNLFQKHYPITAGAGLARGGAAAPTATRAAEVDLERVAVHGFAAYGLLRQAFAELAEASRRAGVGEAVLGAARDLAAEAPRVDVRLEMVGEADPVETGAACRISFGAPGPAARLVLATPWPAEVAAGLGAEVEWFAPYMDSRPLMARVGGGGDDGVDVYSTRNRLLAVANLSVDGVAVAVATPQYLLLNFLYEAHVAEDAGARDLFVEHYAATLKLLEAGGLLIAALRAQGRGPAVPEGVYRAFVESSPFGLPVRTIGETNHGASYLIRLAQSVQKVGGEPPALDLPDPANAPPRYFPGGKHTPGEHPAFDYATNRAFQRAGQPIAEPDS